MAVIRKSRTKAVLFMLLLVFIGIVTGFFLGTVVAKKKEDPLFWKEAVRKQLSKLHPTPEQRQKLEQRTDSAVQEVVVIKADVIKKLQDVVERAVADIDKELTPEQRKTFEKLKPKKPGEQK